MDELSWSEQAIYQGIAFGRIFPRRYTFLSTLLSVLIGLISGVAALLHFDFIDSVSSVSITAELASIWAFGVFCLCIGLGCGVSAYVCYGLLSPSDIQHQLDTLRNPGYYIGYIVMLMGIGIAVFGIVLFLDSLSPVLAVILASFLAVFRYFNDGYLAYYARNKRQAMALSIVVIVAPVLVFGALYLSGQFPDWSLSEWTVALVYGTTVQLGVTGPANAVTTFVDEKIDLVGGTVACIDAFEARNEELKENAPEGVTIELEVPETPKTYSESVDVMEMVATEEYPTLFEAYETYIAAYERLQSEFDETVESRAIAGDEDDLGTFVARLARNVHPNHYTDSEAATTAAKTLSSVVDNYVNGYLEEIVDDIDAVQRERLVDQEGPDIEQLRTIQSEFDAAYA